MVTFACKKISKEDLIRCSFNLNKTSYKALLFMMNKKEYIKVSQIAEEMNLERSSIQKAISSLYESGLISRSQKNLDKGGFIYLYKSKPKREIKDKIKNIINNWHENTMKEIDRI